MHGQMVQTAILHGQQYRDRLNMSYYRGFSKYKSAGGFYGLGGTGFPYTLPLTLS